MNRDTVVEGKDLELVNPGGSESPPCQGCRCIRIVSHRHSIDEDGCILSDSVSNSRTPRPTVQEDTTDHANEESGKKC